MATSFVEFKNYGFWSNDGFLEGTLYLLIKEFKNIEPSHEWLDKVIEEWTFASTAGFCGCIPVCLDEYFNTEVKHDILKQSLEKVLHKLHTVEHYITKEELNANKVSDGGWLGINLLGFVNTAELMLELINGKLKTDASSPINYLRY